MDWRLKLIYPAASVATFLAIWQLVAARFIDPFFLPTPVAIVKGSAELFADGSLVMSALASLARIMSGWLLGSLIAIPIGLAIGASRLLQSIVDPFVHFFRFIRPHSWSSSAPLVGLALCPKTNLMRRVVSVPVRAKSFSTS